jgi:RHS repeat-associated protein
MKQKTLSSAFVAYLIFSICAANGQTVTPYGTVDIGIGTPLFIASNGTVVIKRNSANGSPYRYRAGIDQLIGNSSSFFLVKDMSDRGDIVGYTPGPAPTAYAIYVDNSASTLTQWGQTGQSTVNIYASSGLTTINENRLVTGFKANGTRSFSIWTETTDSFLSTAPFSFSVVASVTHTYNLDGGPPQTYSGEYYTFRDINTNGGGIGIKTTYPNNQPADSSLYYGTAPQLAGNAAFEPYSLNNQNLVGGLANNSFKLWDPTINDYRMFSLPNPVTRDSIRITSSSGEGGAIHITDPAAHGPETPTYILVGNNLIIRTWRDADGNPLASPNHTVLAASQLLPPGSAYTNVALKNIANNGLIVATGTAGDGQTHAFILIPPGLDASFLKPNDILCGGDQVECPMATCSAHAMSVSLNIQDTPFRYTPPFGPAVKFTVTYNQRENQQPATFDYSNLGPNWTFNWLSYILDDPDVQAAITTVYVPGGGVESYAFNESSQTFAPDPQSHAVLVRIQSSPIKYEKRFPDGSKQVFAKSDSSSSYPRRIFLTEVFDPAGNKITLGYDSNLRLISIADALGQTSTLEYNEADSFKISKIVEPFPLGRFARFTYTSGRLTKITDEIGIESQFHYPPNTNFIDTLTTPYGDSHFTHGGTGTNLWLEMTDPEGGIERVEYRDNAPGIDPNDPSGSVPSGFSNTGLDVANTFFWSKRAMELYGASDYTKARIVHWLYNPNETVSGIASSDKQPLENRVWYAYDGQLDSNHTGPSANPSQVARVLDDDATQRWQYEYNDLGKMTKSTDPRGREMTFEYYPNNVDLKNVRQTTGSNDEVLRSLEYYQNGLHQVYRDIDAGQHITTYTYTPYSQVESFTNARGEPTTYGYGDGSAGKPVGYLTSITSPPFEGFSATTSFTYDGERRVQKVKYEPDDYETTTTYDYLDRPLRITYPDSTFQEFAYEQDFALGQGPKTILDLTQSTDRQGKTTVRHYNKNRQMDSISEPIDGSAYRTTNYNWCTCGALESIRDANQNVTTFFRDVQSRVYRKEFQDGRGIDYLYGSQIAPNTPGATSRLTAMTDALGQRTSYSYNSDDDISLTSYTDSNGQHLGHTPNVGFIYDDNYNRLKDILLDGAENIHYEYYPVTGGMSNGAGQVYTVDGPFSNDTIEYVYDNIGRLIIQLVNGIEAGVTYDSLGRVASTDNELGHFTRVYDGATHLTPRLKTLTYQNGQTANYSYFDNAHDRRLQTLQNLRSTESTISQFDYTYDSEGQIETTSALGIAPPLPYTPLDYDEAKQLTRVIRGSIVGEGSYGFQYGYDAAGNRLSNLAFNPTSPSSGKVYTANNLNQLDSVSILNGNSQSAPVAITYDANGNMTYDGDKQTFEWDAANRLIAINYIDSGNRTEFAYDGLGRRVRITEYGSAVTATVGPKGGDYVSFESEKFSLPTGEYIVTFDGLNPNGGNNTALIDQVLLTVTPVSNGGFEDPTVNDFEIAPNQSGWTYSGLAGIAANGGQLIGTNPPPPEGNQAAFVTNNGSMWQAGSVTPGTYVLAFQAAQRENGNDSSQQLRVNIRGAQSTKNFVWSGNTIVEERNSTGASTTKRFFSEGEQRVGGSAAGIYYYTRDHLGSIRELTDSNGTVRGQYQYDAWGNSTVVAGTISIDFGFTGHYFHQTSGLNLTRTRAYSPTLGRWLSRDPIAEVGGVNLYGYVSNDPINFWDPFGLIDVLVGIAPRWFTPAQLADYNRRYHTNLTLDDNAAENIENARDILAAIDAYQTKYPLAQGDTITLALISSAESLQGKCKKYDNVLLFAHGNTLGDVQNVALGFDSVPVSRLPSNCSSFGCTIGHSRNPGEVISAMVRALYTLLHR